MSNPFSTFIKTDETSTPVNNVNTFSSSNPFGIPSQTYQSNDSIGEQNNFEDPFANVNSSKETLAQTNNWVTFDPNDNTKEFFERLDKQNKTNTNNTQLSQQQLKLLQEL